MVRRAGNKGLVRPALVNHVNRPRVEWSTSENLSRLASRYAMIRVGSRTSLDS